MENIGQYDIDYLHAIYNFLNRLLETAKKHFILNSYNIFWNLKDNYRVFICFLLKLSISCNILMI